MPPDGSAFRVCFDTPAVAVRAAAAADGATATGESRRIEGVLVPYNVEGRAADGVLYSFDPGSLKPLRSVTPFLLGHDRNRPIGVLASHQDSDTALFTSFTVDPTPDGDVAIAQAQSGSRGSLSIGAQPVVYTLDESGPELVVRVQEAEWVDASLVTTGAYAGAQVTKVAAQAPEGATMPPDTLNGAATSQGTGLAVASDTAAGAYPAPPAAPAASTAVELAAGHPRIAVAERPRTVELCAGELVGLIIRAQHGEPDARRQLVEAALAETISTDVSGLLPPTYERTVIGGKDVARPLYNLFRSRPLPGVGLLVNKPKWTTPPDGAWAPNVDADATTSKVIVGSQQATVQRWDWAGAISWVVVQRSDPSIVDAIYAEAIQDFYLDVEAIIYAELSAAAPGVSTTLGAAIAEFYTATGDRTAPEIIVMAPDVWGEFADVGQLNVSIAQGPSSAASGELSTSWGGIRATVSGTLAPGEVVMATRRAVDARVTEPVRLTANAIGALNVELAVVGEGLFDTDYPAELLKFGAIVPAAAGLGAGASRRLGAGSQGQLPAAEGESGRSERQSSRSDRR